MKTYQFPLATVKRIRNLEERLARERLLEAQRELRRAQGVYRTAHHALATNLGLQAPTTVENFQWLHDQTTRLGVTLHESAAELLRAAAERDQVNQSWSAARRRSEVLTRLDAEAISQWRELARREEVAELDDLTSARYSWEGATS